MEVCEAPDAGEICEAIIYCYSIAGGAAPRACYAGWLGDEADTPAFENMRDFGRSRAIRMLVARSRICSSRPVRDAGG